MPVQQPVGVMLAAFLCQLGQLWIHIFLLLLLLLLLLLVVVLLLLLLPCICALLLLLLLLLLLHYISRWFGCAVALAFKQLQGTGLQQQNSRALVCARAAAAAAAAVAAAAAAGGGHWQRQCDGVTATRQHGVAADLRVTTESPQQQEWGHTVCNSASGTVHPLTT
jgi:hypothetical protein